MSESAKDSAPSKSNVVRFKKPSPKKKAEGKTLCRHGFHKWRPDPRKQFDVKQGRLVSVHECSRCGHRKTTLS